jgi:5-methylcytosine-specific restriction enzyme A
MALWTDDELRASIHAYFEMLTQQRSGVRIVKANYYRELAENFGRTPKAFEYRMQNISHVLFALGREWLSGLPPAPHVGANVIARIEKIIADVEGTIPTGQAAIDADIRAALKRQRIDRPPQGKRRPARKIVSHTTFERDLDVVAWVLKNAEGKCERCHADAPFTTTDGMPFLEVHHVRRLADDGPDIVENAIAVCPNCHRALHHALDRDHRRDLLYQSIPRLQRE